MHLQLLRNLAVVAAVLNAQALVALAGEAFPYQARVTAPEATLHSGPGDEYYATDVLSAGTTMEVYNEAPGGWLAIRPPEGSYSWVFSRHVEVLENGLGRINKSDVASRIGSLQNEKREVIQVRLQEGELVALIEQPGEGDGLWIKVQPPSGEFRWVHADDVEIMPDAAIQTQANESVPDETNRASAAVDFSSPTIEETQPEPLTDLESASDDAGGWTRQTVPLEPPPDQVENAISTAADVASPEQVAPHVNVPLSDSGWVVTAAHNEPAQPAPTASSNPAASSATETSPPPLLDYPPPPQRVAEDPRFKSPLRNDDYRRQQAVGVSQSRYGTQAPASTPATQATSAPSSPPADGGSGEFSLDFAQKLTALEWQLSQTVADDRGKWHLEMLERDAEALLTAATTVAERTAAKHTLSKIDRFASIQRRFERAATTAITPTTVPPQLTAVQPPVPNGATMALQAPLQTAGMPIAAPPATASPTPPVAYRQAPATTPPVARTRSWRYDAEGILRPVRSTRPGAPQYVLVDEAGRLVTFVTPTPDVDPEPFLGKRVGIVGRSEFLPDIGQSIVTAGRISPLARPLLR